MKIKNFNISSKNKSFIIAEIGQNHDGSLGTLHSYIDAVASTGVEAIKFQMHLAEYESSYQEPFRVNFARQDKTRFDYWKRMEFSISQWQEIADHCNEVGLIFLCSPFSIEAVDILKSLKVPAWKIGSGEIYNDDLLEYIFMLDEPTIISTGMSNWADIDNVYNKIKYYRLKNFSFLQCTSSYPVDITSLGLNVINEIKERYNCSVGFSDHSGDIFCSLAAISNQAEILELHVTFDKRLYGPDIKSSLTIEELNFVNKYALSLNKLKNNPVDKDEIYAKFETYRSFFSRSIGFNKDMKKGDRISKNDLTLLKPGSGISKNNIDKLINKKLVKNVKKNNLVKWDDLLNEA